MPELSGILGEMAAGRPVFWKNADKPPAEQVLAGLPVGMADILEAVGQSKATILSAFRTPETNAMLAARSLGVAEHSQHLLGRALDVTLSSRLPDAHRSALDLKRGGVGWYPRSHFLHIDTGPLRSWEMFGRNLDGLFAPGARSPRHPAPPCCGASCRRLLPQPFTTRHSSDSGPTHLKCLPSLSRDKPFRKSRDDARGCHVRLDRAYTDGGTNIRSEPFSLHKVGGFTGMPSVY